MNLYYHAWRYLLRAAVPLLTKIEVRGREYIPRTGPLLLISNHISLADPPILIGYTPRQIHFMLKAELFRNPLFWLLFTPGEAIRVHRGKADRVALRQTEAAIKAGDAVAIYPEGTRSHVGAAQEARAGAVFIAQRTRAPILPVAISGTESIFSSRFPWYRRARVRLTYGRPFALADLDDTRAMDREELAHAMMERVAQLLPPQYRGVYGEEHEPSAHPA